MAAPKTLGQMDIGQVREVASEALARLAILERRIEGYRNFQKVHQVRQVMVFEVGYMKGDGVSDPIRSVIQWWLPGSIEQDARLIGEDDPCSDITENSVRLDRMEGGPVVMDELIALRGEVAGLRATRGGS